MKSLLDYARSENERLWVQAVIDCGDMANASLKLGIPKSTFNDRINRLKADASKRGWNSQVDQSVKVRDGFAIKRVSEYYKDGEVANKWVISEPTKQAEYDAMREAIAYMVGEVEGKAQPVRNVNYAENDLLVAYIIGDQHHSMLSWHEETGDDYDMNISEQLLKGAVDHLTQSTPTSSTALIVNVGDFLHGNDSTNRTPKSGNVLDVDGRLTKIIRTAMMLMVSVVDKCLQKHNIVEVRNALGNHSYTLEMFMSEFLSAWYRNEPRVKIHNQPRPFWYHQFGSTLLGVTHGDTIKPTELGELMAQDCHSIWSNTRHRYWLLGHVHSKHAWELRSCMAESFNTLAAKDAWHNEHGYRAKRNMTAITYHKKHGEIARNTVDIGALNGNVEK